MEGKMNGRIIDINNSGAFVELTDGTTKEIPFNRLPTNAKLGDNISIDPTKSLNMVNNMMIDIF